MPKAKASSSSVRSRTVPAAIARTMVRAAADTARRVARMHPYTRAATAASRVVRNAARAFRGNTARKKKYIFDVKGKYAGKFKVKKNRIKKIDTYLKYGFLNTTEINGTIDDPDCVYVGHTTYSPLAVLEQLMCSLARKLFRKIGYDITHLKQRIDSFVNLVDGSGFCITLVTKDLDTGFRTRYSFPLAINGSLYTIFGSNAEGVAPQASGIMNFLYEWMSQDNQTQNNTRLDKLEVGTLIGATGSPIYVMAAQINLNTEKVHLYCKSQLKLQNRTRSATGSSSMEDINNNPLQGKLYHLGTGVPSCKVDDVHFIERIRLNTGVLLARGAEFTVNTGMREPPPAKLFKSVLAFKNQILQPGEIKKDIIYFEQTKDLNNFLLGLRYAPKVGSNQWETRVAGRSSIICMEDMINVNAGERITLAYEVNREVGIWTESQKVDVSGGNLMQLQYSNTTPG